IRRGVLRAERRSGVAKPALLCLMGAAGAVAFGGEGEGEAPWRHVFPSYRFPESAARALARAVQYAAFRRRPSGRILVFDDIDPARARAAVAEALAGADGPRTVDGVRAEAILREFRLAADGGARIDGEPAVLAVSSDPTFGPLLRIARGSREPVVRITPLTDNDSREVLEAAGLAGVPGAAELLGRVSRMIEELPWLSGMRGEVRRGAGESAPPLGLGGDLRIDLQRLKSGSAAETATAATSPG
ncbi:MAG TPA: hypothetical protein VG777_06515, partial [Thermoanaerobaculia bacterium]|nr:hypothetical protein [Thermoanaerobaculia bacterium]